MWRTYLLFALYISAQTGDVIPEGNGTEPEIVALYPNPIHDGNRGEFIVVHVPKQTHLGNWTFRDDGRQRAKPPPVSVNGTVAFSHDPQLVEEHLDMPVYELEGWLQLAVDGEEVILEIDGEVVDTVGYEGYARQAQLWLRDRDDPWVPLGATSFDPVSATATGRVFVLPDSPEVLSEALVEATERIYVGGYELGDERLIEALITAHDRGVDVAVHAEGRPVGGVTKRHGAALDRLAEAGIEVTVIGGPYRRWNYHHPKYLVVDDTVLVTTENFKESGTGGRASRGWGVILESSRLADAATSVFMADSTWEDAIPWSTYRDETDRFTADESLGTFEQRHPPRTLDDVNATLLVAPEAAESSLTDVVASARETIHIKQVRISDIEFPLMATALERARDGVQVRILLSDRWYVRDENREFADTVSTLASTENLDIEVKLVDDTDRFDRIHAKGLIVDEETVVVGSINWNNNSLRKNREMAVIIHDEGAASYFLGVFEGDWQTAANDLWRLPIGLLLVATATVGLTAVHAYRLRVDGPDVGREESVTERVG